MKICVFGAGAVGGHLAARLANAGHAVSIIARAATVDAVARDGLTLTSGPETIKARVQAFTSSTSAGAQDLVLVTVKATATSSIAEALPPLLGPQTPVIFVVNGIPWWYALGPNAQTLKTCPPMDFLDPGGRLARSIDIAQVIGSTVFSSNEVSAPGAIINRSPGLNTLTLGELDGRASERIAAISAMVEATGFAAPVSTDIRKNVWTKLVSSNLSVLPICALVRQPMIVFSRNRQLLDLAKAIVREGLAVSAAAGYPLDLDPDALFDERRITTMHKPSMLQDMENGRALEIDAVLTAVQRFARAARIPTPHLDSVAAIVAQLAADAGLYTFPKP
jgi:2-dehydropantoate 2-reductase